MAENSWFIIEFCGRFSDVWAKPRKNLWIEDFQFCFPLSTLLREKLTCGILNNLKRLATWMDVTDEAAPTTPLMTFLTCVLLQLHSSPSMLLMEPEKRRKNEIISPRVTRPRIPSTSAKLNGFLIKKFFRSSSQLFCFVCFPPTLLKNSAIVFVVVVGYSIGFHGIPQKN